MKTLGQLKLELMHRGISLSEEARNHEAIASGLIRDNGDEEIVFSLSEDFFVRTFIQPSGIHGTPMEIRDGKIYLDTLPDPHEVVIIPIPKFLREKKKSPNPVAANISLDGYCLNLFLRKVGQSGALNLSPPDVIGVIRAAFEEGAADLVQLNMDYCDDADRGFPQLAPLIRLIKKNFRTFVSLRGFPPEDMKVIDRLYAAGVDLLVFPMEGFYHREDLSFPIPGTTVLEALEYAAGAFPPGTVFTELALPVGEEVPSISQKIVDVAARGIVPFLQLPEKGLQSEPEYQEIADASQYLSQSMQKQKLSLKWLYPAGRLLSALDASFYTESPDKARLCLRPIYKSTLGKTATEGFSALRRKLRVKDINDSYESAGL